MVDVTYPGVTATARSTRVLLTNARGDYLSLGVPNTSNYDGFFVNRNGYAKILWNVLPVGELHRVEFRDGGVVRVFDTGEQRITLNDHGVLFEGGECTLTLDCKRLHDESEEGRVYDIEFIEALDTGAAEGVLAKVAVVHVSYRKYHGEEYTFHVCIATTHRPTLVRQWREVTYEYDQRRGTHGTPWVFNLATLAGQGVVALAVGDDKNAACRNAVEMLLRKDETKQAEHGRSPAQALASRSLRALTNQEGIIAGLPWFHQHWSRDELIALGGLLATAEYDLVVRVLDKWYTAVKDDGTLPAIYPDEGLTSVDAPGWLGKRTLDLLEKHSPEREMLERWHVAAKKLLEKVTLTDDLVWNDTNETWMDTARDDDGRAGARIEIQALYLALSEAYAALCAKLDVPCDVHLGPRITQAVHERLVAEGKLLDGLNVDGSPDTTTRPNLFLAWYVCPRLFTNDEWAGFFRAVLPELWLDWGGLTSISKEHPLFREHDTGEDVAAYHRGDSWYYVNNIAALAMHAVDSRGFAEYVHHIVEASTRDLLEHGYLGHASEISSAAQQEPMGCHAQAWSASTLLELLLKTDEEDFYNRGDGNLP